MKTLIATAALALMAGTIQGQDMKEAQVPAAVSKSYHDQFKDAKTKSWEKEKNGTYEVEFTSDKKESYAVFNAEGQWLESGSKLSKKELPPAAIDYLDKNYGNYKVDEVKQVVAPTGDTTYDVEIKTGSQELEIIFNATGGFKQERKD